MRKVLPIALIITLAVVGCTMNRTPGAGQPVTATPSASPATTPGTSYGNTPMTSSYLPVDSSRADQAAAILRQHQGTRERFLGYLNPTPMAHQPQQEYLTGQFIPPSLSANPQITVNSSISSSPYPVITSGAADVGSVSGSTTGAFILPGSSTAVSTGTTGATTAAATITPTTVATTTPTTVLSSNINTLTPTAAAAATPSPIASSNAVLGQLGTQQARLGTATTTGTTSTTAALTANTPMASAAISTPLTTNSSVVPSTQATTSALTLGQATGGKRLMPASVRGGTPIVVTTSPSGQIVISNTGRTRAVRP